MTCGANRADNAPVRAFVADPQDYDAWYRTPRGAWIGDTEYRLLKRLLAAAGGNTLLDVGCGTGYFSRRFASDGLSVTGIDPSPALVSFARAQRTGDETYLVGDARRLPFPDGSFDVCASVTSLCFIQAQERALSEMLRVTRGHLVLGVLNRHSLLYRRKGMNGGTGAYRGAHWHTPTELRRLLASQHARGIRIRSAIYLPNGGLVARAVEGLLANRLPIGAFLAVVAQSSCGATPDAEA